MLITRALSIRQPWCWLIINGLKDIEVRNWSTPFRGYFAIHASKIFDEPGFEYLKGLMSIPMREEYPKGIICGYAYLFEVKDLSDPDVFTLLKDRHLNDPGWWGPAKRGFVLQEITPLPHIVSKGKLGLYKLKKPVEIDDSTYT
jgi:hypothetical protein